MDQELRELIARLEARGLEPEEAERYARSVLAEGSTVARGPALEPKDLVGRKPAVGKAVPIVEGVMNDVQGRRGSLGRAILDSPKGVVREVGQGATFGYGDEIESKVTGRDVNEIRGEMDEFRGEHRGVALASEMAGGLPWMAVPGLNAVRGGQMMSTGARVTQGARSGLLAGALYGSGASNAGSLAGRAGGAALGGTFGGLLGAAVPAATAGVGTVLRHARDKTFRSPLEWMQRNGANLGRFAPTTADEVADALVAKAMMRGGVTLDAPYGPLPRGVLDADRILDGAIPEERAVDLFGESTRRAARGSMAIPNDAYDEAAAVLINRGESEASRVGSIIDDIFQVPDVNLDRVAVQMKDGLRSASDDAYQAAYAKPFTPSEELREIINRAPAIRDISRQHRASMLELGVEYPDMFARGPGGGLGPATSVESLDAVKRALDDAVTAAYNKGRGTEAGVLKGIRDQIVDELDAGVPEYRTARSIWRGGLEADAALEAGRKYGAAAGTTGPSTVETALENLGSDAERELFRLGWINSLRERVVYGTTPGHQVAATTLGVKPTGNVRGNVREAFQQLFPEKNTDEFFSRLQQQSNMRQSERAVLAGSPTARIQEDIRAASDMTSAGAGATGLRETFARGPKAGLGAMADFAERAHHANVAGGMSRRLILEDPRALVNRLRNTTSPDKLRKSILWQGGLDRAGSIGAGLLSGRSFGSLFN